MKAFKNLVDAQVAIINPHDYKQQEQQDHADGRTERPVQRSDDPLENEIADHVVARTSQYHGGQVGAGRQHENQQTTGADAGKAQWQRHFPKRLPFGAAHGAGRFEKALVDAFQADIDIQHHERQQIHDQAHQYRKFIVQHRYRRLYQTDLHQEVIDQPGVTHDVDPAHGADDEADPKREHDEQKISLFIAAFATVEKIGGDISQDKAEKDSFKRDANRADENFGIKEIFEEFGVITELEGGNVRPAWGAQPEAVDNDEANRDYQQQKNRTESG